MCLRVEEEDGQEFESNPATIDGEELPTDVVKSDRVHVCGEEASALAKDLLDSDTHSTLRVREQFNKIGYKSLLARFIN